jgi:HAD superfamily hydrolase (TIGR01509 family)
MTAAGAATGLPDEASGDWPRAFIFDMDGLLFNSERLALRALDEAARSLELDLPHGFSLRLIGVPADRSRELLFEQLGPCAPADRLLAEATVRLHAAIDGGRLRLQPGLTELLAWLDACEIPRAVATSSSRAKAAHHLRATAIEDRFDAIVTRDDVARGKPHPDLYLKAAAALGRRPAECLALEDSHNGVRAAHAAGVPVVMVPDVLQPDDEMRRCAVAIVDTLHGVRPWLANARAARRARCVAGD